jgi:hypothetical protein
MPSFFAQMIEEKLDGERINIHKRGNVFQYLSRFVPSSWLLFVFTELTICFSE